MTFEISVFMSNREVFLTFEICNSCKKVGHVEAACRNKRQSGRNYAKKGNRTRTYRIAEGVESSNSDDEDELHFIKKISQNSTPYMVKLMINDAVVDFEIDTGSGITIIPELTFNKLFGNRTLLESKMTVRTYSNEKLSVIGKFYCTVTHNDKTYPEMKIIVLEGDGVSLLGRNWLNEIDIDWSKVIKSNSTGVHAINSKDKSLENVVESRLKKLLKEYDCLFEKRLGRIKDYKAKLNLKSDAVPKYSKARTVPFALEEAVSNELDRLEKEGVLESVSHSDWASPIVIIPRSDGRLRICGDFKRTINPYLENEEYHIPSPDEVFSKIQEGNYFQKLI